MLLNLLEYHFKPASKYLVRLQRHDEIDSVLKHHLYERIESRHRKDLWGTEAKRVIDLGRQIGWVSGNIEPIFFANTVVEEIAESMAAAKNMLDFDDAMLTNASNLLKALHLSHLAHQEPFMLSEGESKLVWFLCQYAKCPRFLVIGNLNNALSSSRTQTLLEFISNPDLQSHSSREEKQCIIIGYIKDEFENIKKLDSHQRWITVKNWPIPWTNK
ncbi:MAG: hypothetical protein V2J62_13035 [candidate division KSB1 bacterium]|jgi:energy-coupling factor transporter ATP-binding protein EcfA2|nr:hypothetical protein [candidate division KSB1 bacterium]